MAMTTAAVSGGPILAPEQLGDLVVRPVFERSIAMQASTVVTTRSHDYRIPVVVTDPSAAWVDEGAEITPSDADLDEITVTPPKVAGLTIISRELADDTDPAAAEQVGAGLARDIARRVDQAYFSTQPAPAPAGLSTLAGVTTVTGPAAWANLDPFSDAQAQSEDVGGQITAWIANSATARTLANLKEASGSNRPLLGADRSINGLPLLVSPYVAADTVWGIPAAHVFVVVRDDTTVEVSRDAYFSSDQVGVKATMRVGFGFPHPAAVMKVVLGA